MGLILVALFSIFLSIFSILFIVLEIYVGIIGQIKGAPFVPSKPQKIQTMLDLADITPGTRIIDLGSGSGSIVIAAAKRGAIGVGIDINPFLIHYSRWRARCAGVQNRTTFIKREIKNFSVSDADVVFLYLLPSLLEKISPQLSAELKTGARIISNSFPIARWMPAEEKNGVFLYYIS